MTPKPDTTSQNPEQHAGLPVVISGLGAVTPYGIGTNVLWQALLRGDSAISAMDLFDLNGIPCTRAGVVRMPVSPAGFEDAPRATRFAAEACREALDQAGLMRDAAARGDTALVTASNFADMTRGERALIPADTEGRDAALARHCAQATACEALAEGFSLGGLRLPISLSCASGAAAAACAAELIAAGRAQRVLVVGFDALSRFAWSGLCSLRTMSRKRVRPFDADRDGTIFTEGAAALVIERADLCAARGATPLAVLAGWATGNNGHHMTAPALRGAGSFRVMRDALARAGLAPDRVDHLNLHGTGTQPNDLTETEAVYDLFGQRVASLPVTSVKGTLGHMLGAAGSVELAVSVLTLSHGIIPPTGNLTRQDPACPLDVVTVPRETRVRCVLSNSAGFGGCNAAAVILAPDEPFCPPAVLRPAAVVITGMGVVSALGADVVECAAALRENEPALAPWSRLSPEGVPPLSPVGEAPEFDLTEYGVSRKTYLDRASELFLAACGEALHSAGRETGEPTDEETGILAGTAWGCLSTAERFFDDYLAKGPRFVRPFLFPHAYANTAVSLAAIEWGLTGPHGNFVSRETASGIALVQAIDLIRAGQARRLVAGGVDALSLTRLAEGAPDAAVPGEAAAAVMLECAPDAVACGSDAVARIIGCGLATDPQSAVADALAQAGCMPVAVYVNGTAARDAAGALVPDVPVIAPEALCGAVQGASTVLHLVLALLAGHDGPVLVLTAEACTSVALVVEPAKC
ncbi:MAG TPA: beta-ketoacyl-[acyl-carrier-protein] synthase family protein [Kiritimatiellia bacterium]|jgi:3-oxoacyl-(acyl-carrier-protein) synthase|nr:beta-ketoacyl-[acyl-carrier-protein] synthase family protein [Kiritimatiellia bacterium]